MIEKNPKRSVWHRWDPHMHAPGTILNNQFSGPNDGWDGYVTRLNAATPEIRAVGVTDYYSLEMYKKVRQLKDAGKFTKTVMFHEASSAFTF